MRFSIVFDDNGTVLAASGAGEETQKLTLGPGVSTGHIDISDEVPDAELPQTVERVFVDMDPRKLKRVPAGKEADDGES
jgi:hypothetical protein